jgi:hypothetical protein
MTKLSETDKDWYEQRLRLHKKYPEFFPDPKAWKKQRLADLKEIEKYNGHKNNKRRSKLV